MFDVETQISSWKDYLRARGNFKEPDIEELEGHLREEIDNLQAKGLSVDEAFFISVKRLGNADALSREFSKINTESLWKQLMIEPGDPHSKARIRRETGFIVILCLLAGTFAKLPELFGFHLFGGQEVFYFKNLSFFILPMIAVFFAWKRRLTGKLCLMIALPFVLAFLAANLYPSYEPAHNQILMAIHMPILLWLVLCIAYGGGGWAGVGRRMDFLRFTGETFIYTVLILCGGAVLIWFLFAIFSSIDVDITYAGQEFVAVYGGMAAPVAAVYLVEAKKSIVENLAPVLARIFSPLFLLAMISFLLVMAILKKSPYMEREFLIGFDVMLALVLGLVLYVISARGSRESAGFFDYMNFALIAAALIIDAIALSAILFRLSSFGASPNKMAALGENIALLVNLAGLAFLYVRFFLKKIRFKSLEAWQTAYLPVYAGWAAVVIFLFPVIFGFR